MNKRELLKEIGWSDKLVDAFQVREDQRATPERAALAPTWDRYEDSSNIIIHVDEPLLKGGTRF
jgi:hypothetical protein